MKSVTRKWTVNAVVYTADLSYFASVNQPVDFKHFSRKQTNQVFLL